MHRVVIKGANGGGDGGDDGGDGGGGCVSVNTRGPTASRRASNPRATSRAENCARINSTAGSSVGRIS